MARLSYIIIVIVHLLYYIHIVNSTNYSTDLSFWGHTTPTLIYNESMAKFEVYNLNNFKNEAVVQIIHPIDKKTYCLKPPYMDFRHIYLNGTINPFQIDFSFPKYNFCPGPSGLYSFDAYYIDANLMLIQYVNSSDIDSASFYGMLVDDEGNIFRFVNLLNFLCNLAKHHKKSFPNLFLINL